MWKPLLSLSWFSWFSWFSWLWLLLLYLGLAGCGHVDVERYRQEQPPLELRELFTGRLQAWGVFENRSGEVVKRFHVIINGYSRGEQLVLDEAFTYGDGTRQQRVWTLTPDGPGRWRGTAGDVVGEARGESAGNTLRWRYVLSQPVDGRVYDLSVDDWMHRLDAQTMISRSSVTKFGVEVGRITVFFRKQS